MTPALDLQPSHDLDMNKMVHIHMLPAAPQDTGIGLASEIPMRKQPNVHTNGL